MIEGNLRLVLSVIQRFAGRGENMDDLFQIGCIGLIKAIDHFDAEQFSARFSTYGVPMIAGEIRRSMRDVAYKVLKTRENYLREHQKEPSIEEIAKQLELRREEIVFALDAISDPISLYEPIYSDGSDAICVMDQVRDDKNCDEQWLNHLALREAMGQLGEREQRILKLRFFQGKTQMEVSKEVGISQAQVSRLEKNALKQIRKEL